MWEEPGEAVNIEPCLPVETVLLPLLTEKVNPDFPEETLMAFLEIVVFENTAGSSQDHPYHLSLLLDL